jgi:bacillithiol biosynthesis deacetylase BshB1
LEVRHWLDKIEVVGSDFVEAVDIVAIGAHPDDVEIGCGGLLAKEISRGYTVGIVDLTLGELGTNGTVEERQVESQNAAKLLGAKWRVNLQIADNNIDLSQENLAKVIEVIRKAKPKLLMAHYWLDRHPDHEAASQLITKANFQAGLRMLYPELEPHRAKEILYYFVNYDEEPTFIVDISEFFEKKKEIILAHVSQFKRENRFLPTILNESMPHLVESRNRYFGAKIKALYGEGYVIKNSLAMEDPMEHWGG